MIVQDEDGNPAFRVYGSGGGGGGAPSDFQNAIPLLTSASSDYTSASFNRPEHKELSFQFIAVGLNASTGVIKLQDSLDDINWNDITGASITVASGSNTNMIRYTAFTSSYVRAVWSKNTNSAGTISGNFLFKS